MSPTTLSTLCPSHCLASLAGECLWPLHSATWSTSPLPTAPPYPHLPSGALLAMGSRAIAGSVWRKEPGRSGGFEAGWVGASGWEMSTRVKKTNEKPRPDQSHLDGKASRRKGGARSYGAICPGLTATGQPRRLVHGSRSGELRGAGGAGAQYVSRPGLWHGGALRKCRGRSIGPGSNPVLRRARMAADFNTGSCPAALTGP